VGIPLQMPWPYPYATEPDPEGETEAWRGARVAWLGKVRQNARLVRMPVPICVARVENPEPARELASVSLVAHTTPFVLAITAEPVADAKR
jgi:hypothetical protein